MLNDFESNRERYYEAVRKSLKALSSRDDLTIEFSDVAFLDIRNNSLTLPNIKSKNEFSYLRGLADSYAFRYKFHQNVIMDTKLSNIEQTLFDLLEEARCEALGIKIFPGAKQNIECKLRKELSNSQNSFLEIQGSFHQFISGYNLFPQSTIDKYIGAFIELKQNLENPIQFGINSIKLIKSLKLNEGEERVILTSIQTDNEIDTQARVGQGSEESEIQINHFITKETMEKNLNPGGAPQHHTFLDNRLVEYKIFTEEFDEIIAAEQLESIDKLNNLRRQLDLKTVPHRKVFERMAQKFRQKLLSRKYCVWERFNDNGVLDSKSLAGFIATPYKWEIFKQLKEDDYNDTVVTLLIDNSGSMRGTPIATAAVISDLLAKTLDTLQIKTEVIGYTTANWKGGKSFAKWLSTGSPLQPGRLGELRHIIYKQAYCSWRKAKRNFGLMIKEGILKENIDGEALKWAAKRILAMPQQRKILVVISDGVPLDEATIANNLNNYLGLHLSHIIAKIERMPVRLFAIGIGHDISGFYKNSLKIENHEILGKALFEKLAELIVM